MRQKKIYSVLILGWIFLCFFSMINIADGVNVDVLDLTDFHVGDKVVYSYRTYSYQNPITGFAWSSPKYELYNITEISETYNELIIKADFWDKDSLQDLMVGVPDQEDIILGRLKIPPNIGDIIIPNNIKPKDYKNSYLTQIEASINNPAVTNSIQSYARGQGLYIENKYEGKTIGEHTILYATTGILLKETYKISMGTTSDFTSEKEIMPSRSTIVGVDESYSEVIIKPWFFVFIIGVPGLILSVVITRKIMLKRKGIQIIKEEEITQEEIKQEEIPREDIPQKEIRQKEIPKEEIIQEISNNPVIIKKPRVLCPYCNSEVKGTNNYCFKCGINTKEEKKDNSCIFVIMSIIGGLMAFYAVEFATSTNHSSLAFVEFISLVIVIFACTKKTGVIPCLAVIWVLFCIWVFIKYT